MQLTMSQKIRTILKEENVTQSELSRRLNTCYQNVYGKLRRDNFKISTLEAIAKQLGYEFEGYFIDKDGNVI